MERFATEPILTFLWPSRWESARFTFASQLVPAHRPIPLPTWNALFNPPITATFFREKILTPPGLCHSLLENMQSVEFYGDKRQIAACAFCGAGTETRDHVPSRVFLDEPHPANLPHVAACADCNQGLSLDEQYLACLIECTLCGSANAADLRRDKIRRTLEESALLARRLEQARRVGADGAISFIPEPDRVRRVLLKLAQGHAVYELNEPVRHDPSSLRFAPLSTLINDDRFSFEAQPEPELAPWPEVGSRAMVRMVEGQDLQEGWVVVQPGRYRYMAVAERSTIIRLVISEYLGCEAVWA